MNAYDTIIVGMGCAGLKCAHELMRAGRGRVLMLADDINGGTSLNAGSDKQTYYKLTLAGGEGDSVREMARTLFEGGCVDGTHALIEAALSAECFYALCALGVPFPRNKYGEYVGYRTDHDPRRRATSAGPLTSKLMRNALLNAVRAQGCEVRAGRMAIDILTSNGGARGVVCLNTDTLEFEVYTCNHLVWATGGPADIYAHVSFPEAHSGMSGAPLRAGAAGVNLTEWQYGLASVKPRWNVSGSYMQALPRFISTDASMGDAREFLRDTYLSPAEALNLTFLKGYQWPFDARKALSGSSQIDTLVHNEISRGRRVFLDFTQNPYGDAFDFALLNPEADEYILSAGARLPTPIERLMRINSPAYEFYYARGVDLKREPLEIALCAQHMNGGLGVDEWWETRVRGLYAVGEVAGTHGVYRPGGSALNAGQAGAVRAAKRILMSPERAPEDAGDLRALDNAQMLARACVGRADTLSALRRESALRMSACAGAIRDWEGISRLYDDTRALLNDFAARVGVQTRESLKALFRFRDALTARACVLRAMLDYIERGGVSRGSALYKGREAGALDLLKESVQSLTLSEDGDITCAMRDVLPIPQTDDFFENVWREYRQSKW